MIPDWTSALIGIPFVPHGRDEKGVDCWGLLRLAMQRGRGILLSEARGEYKNPCDPTEIKPYVERLRRQDERWREVAEGAEEPGDAVLLRLRGVPMHVGLVVAPGWMLHINRGVRSHLARYRSPEWARRVVAFYRYAE